MSGITHPASVRFRNEEEILAQADDPAQYYLQVVMPEKIRINQEYAVTASRWGDFLVILRTLAGLLR